MRFLVAVVCATEQSLCMDTAAANRLTEDLARHYIVSGQSRLSTVGLHDVDVRSPVSRL